MNSRAALNFFYFVFLDETVALQAATTVAHRLHRKSRKAEKSGSSSDETLIQEVVRSAKAFAKHLHRVKPRKLPGGWSQLPVEEMTAWREFARDADQEILMTATLHLLLGFSPSVIARSLGITEGTVFYRSGRALGLLGREKKP